MYQKIYFHPLTEYISAYLVWETKYTNQCNSLLIQECKLTKFDYFENFRHYSVNFLNKLI